MDGLAPRFLDFGSKCTRAVSVAPQWLYPWGRSSMYPLNGKLGERRTSTVFASAGIRRAIPWHSIPYCGLYTDCFRTGVVKSID